MLKLTKDKQPIDNLKYERECLAQGYKLIAGVDEVGRGPLAGPVCCACVIMPLDDIIEGVDDSKKLSAKKREMLYDQIIAKAIAVRVEMVDEKTIDKLNISQATKLCMANAINNMGAKPDNAHKMAGKGSTMPDIVLVDAVKGLVTNVPTMPIIHGDALSYNIGAASIVAKVTRDRLMDELAKKYPGYGLEKHKGYGTKAHMDAIREHGVTPIHRQSFLGWLYNEQK